jgi:hypothetical protein
MKKQQKQSIMFARVDEWEKSGKTMREFAKEINISKSCLAYWTHKKRDLTIGSPQFVELIPSSKATAGIEQAILTNERSNHAQIVFTFPGGLCVKVYG